MTWSCELFHVSQSASSLLSDVDVNFQFIKISMLKYCDMLRPVIQPLLYVVADVKSYCCI